MNIKNYSKYQPFTFQYKKISDGAIKKLKR